MGLVELLTVTDRFQLSMPDVGTVVVPDFKPRGKKIDPLQTVILIMPDGSNRPASARFGVWHFNIRDPNASPDRVWRLIVSFPDLTADDLMPGTKVMVTPALRDSIVGSDDSDPLTPV